jgi:peptidyl-tRNA hydrolase
LVVVVREDLLPGQQAVQAGHAAIDFQHRLPEISKKWWTHSNYLVYLAVKNEHQLQLLLNKAESKAITHTAFREPDLNNSLTAIALEPCDETRRLVSNLPLALKKSIL